MEIAVNNSNDEIAAPLPLLRDNGRPASGWFDHAVSALRNGRSDRQLAAALARTAIAVALSYAIACVFLIIEPLS
jgi:hypothetical protein